MSKIVDTIKNLLRPKSDLQLAVEELEDAKRHRLQAQSAMEYALRMSEYHTDRIKRLESYLLAHQKSS